MDKESLKTLQILDEVSKNSAITQRTLSRRLGVALGLTNLYLKRLIKKGYIKAVNLKPNRLRYELTPMGIAHKTSLTFRYMQNSFNFYKEARKRIRECFLKIAGENCRRVVFYGSDEVAEIAYLSLNEVPLSLAGVVDEVRAGKDFCGLEVLPLETLKDLRFDKLVVTSFDNSDELKRAFEKFGINEDRISWLNSPGNVHYNT